MVRNCLVNVAILRKEIYMPPRNSGACVAKDTKVIVRNGVNESQKEISQVGINNIVMNVPSWNLKLEPVFPPVDCQNLEQIKSYDQGPHQDPWVYPVYRISYRNDQSLFCSWKLIIKDDSNASHLDIISTPLHPFILDQGAGLGKTQPQTAIQPCDSIFIKRDPVTGVERTGTVTEVIRLDRKDVVGLIVSDQVKACEACKLRQHRQTILTYSLKYFIQRLSAVMSIDLTSLNFDPQGNADAQIEAQGRAVLQYELAVDFVIQGLFFLMKYPELAYTVFLDPTNIDSGFDVANFDNSDSDANGNFNPNDFLAQGMNPISTDVFNSSGESHFEKSIVLFSHMVMNELDLNCLISQGGQTDIVPLLIENLALLNHIFGGCHSNGFEPDMYAGGVDRPFTNLSSLQHFILTNDIPSGTLTPQNGLYNINRVGFPLSGEIVTRDVIENAIKDF